MSKRPVVLVVMDGVGICEKELGNAVLNAYTPTLDELMKTCDVYQQIAYSQLSKEELENAA